MLGAKSGYCTCPLHTTLPKGWANHLSHPTRLTPDTPQPPHQVRNNLASQVRDWRNKTVCYTFFPSAAARALEGLAWISCLASSQFLLIGEGQEHGSYHNEAFRPDPINNWKPLECLRVLCLGLWENYFDGSWGTLEAIATPWWEDKTGTRKGYQSCRGGKKTEKQLGGKIVIDRLWR